MALLSYEDWYRQNKRVQKALPANLYGNKIEPIPRNSGFESEYKAYLSSSNQLPNVNTPGVSIQPAPNPVGTVPLVDQEGKPSFVDQNLSPAYQELLTETGKQYGRALEDWEKESEILEKGTKLGAGRQGLYGGGGWSGALKRVEDITTTQKRALEDWRVNNVSNIQKGSRANDIVADLGNIVNDAVKNIKDYSFDRKEAASRFDLFGLGGKGESTSKYRAQKANFEKNLLALTNKITEMEPLRSAPGVEEAYQAAVKTRDQLIAAMKQAEETNYGGTSDLGLLVGGIATVATGNPLFLYTSATSGGSWESLIAPLLGTGLGGELLGQAGEFISGLPVVGDMADMLSGFDLKIPGLETMDWQSIGQLAMNYSSQGLEPGQAMKAALGQSLQKKYGKEPVDKLQEKYGAPYEVKLDADGRQTITYKPQEVSQQGAIEIKELDIPKLRETYVISDKPKEGFIPATTETGRTIYIQERVEGKLPNVPISQLQNYRILGKGTKPTPMALQANVAGYGKVWIEPKDKKSGELDTEVIDAALASGKYELGYDRNGKQILVPKKEIKEPLYGTSTKIKVERPPKLGFIQQEPEELQVPLNKTEKDSWQRLNIAAQDSLMSYEAKYNKKMPKKEFIDKIKKTSLYNSLNSVAKKAFLKYAESLY